MVQLDSTRVIERLEVLDSELENIIRKVQKASTIFDFTEVDSINTVNLDGENLLHAVVQLEDIEAAQSLIKQGIDIEQPGDLSRTPLHKICDYLADVMNEAQSKNPNIWKQARINQLHKEIARLEQSLKKS